MNREIKTIKLKDCEVDIVSFLTWGENEKIQSELMKGAKITSAGLEGYDPEALLNAKYKALELCVKEIRFGDKKNKFTKEWIDNLSIEEGEKIYNCVNDLSKKKEY